MPANNSDPVISYAFFDFDDTVFKGQSILYWIRFYFRTKPLKRVFQPVYWMGMLLFLFGRLNSATLKRLFILPLSYEGSHEIRRLAKVFIKQEIVPRLYKDMLNRMWAHHCLGHKVAVITASCTFYMKYMYEYFPPCIILSTDLFLPDRGFFRMPKFKTTRGNVKNENKVKLIRIQKELPVDGKWCFAYSDHISDRFLLEFSDFPYCVNPERRLLNLAELENWQCIYPPDRRSGLAEKISNVIMLLFALGGGSPKKDSEDILCVARYWENRDSFPLDLYLDMKNRVESVYPEDKMPFIHQWVFPGLPDRKTTLELARRAGTDTSDLTDTMSYESLRALISNCHLVKDAGSGKWEVKTRNYRAFKN